MIRIGIDPSMNSTGVCIDVNGKYIYYIIVSDMTKKMTLFNHDRVHIINYFKETNKYDKYIDKERQKTSNIYKICACLENIIKQYNPDIIQMEGVSYGSTGSAALVDLSGLNFAIRMMIYRLNKPLAVVAPTSVKKFAVANGQADKNIMINAWKKLDPEMENIKSIKIDDLADAFFISQYYE